MALTRKSLEDLYEVGKEYDISPHGDGSAIVYIRKLGPIHQNEAIRKANADRAVVKAIVKDKSDPRYMAFLAEASEIERDSKIEQLAQTDVAEERMKIEQELSFSDDWGGEEELQGLVDSWENGLLEEWLKGEGERSEESEKVFARIQEFNDSVANKMEARLKQAKTKYEVLDDDQLDLKIVEASIEYEASMTWMRTFRMNQILYGVFNQERETLFESQDDVATLAPELFAKLVEAILDLNTPSLEVKS